MVAAFAAKIPRATSTVAWRSRPCNSSEPSTPAATAARRSLIVVDDVGRREIEGALELERRQLRMLAEDESADRRDVRRREAVPGRARAASAQPGDIDIDASG